VRTQMVQSDLTAAHQAAIQKLLDEKNPAAAAQYFNATKSQILPTIRGDIAKRINEVGVVEQSQTLFDQIIAVPGTATQRLEAARNVPKGAVRDSVVARVRAYNADVARAEVKRGRDVRTDVVELANQGIGQEGWTTEQIAEVAATPGMSAQLNHIAQRIASGRPFISNAAVEGDVYKMVREDPLSFSQLDFTKAPYVGGLNPSSVDRFRSMQFAMDKEDVKREAAAQKEIDRGARLNRGLQASRKLIDSFKLDKEERGIFEVAFTEEIERRSKAGEVLEDSNYQAIVRGLFLEGEQDRKSVV